MEQAVIYTYSEVFSSAAGFQDLVSYTSGIIEKTDGSRCSAFFRSATGKKLTIGAEVRCVGQRANNFPVYEYECCA